MKYPLETDKRNMIDRPDDKAWTWTMDKYSYLNILKASATNLGIQDEYRFLQMLKDGIVKEWWNIGTETTEKLILSMKNLLRDVIPAKGYNTKY